MTQVTTPPSVEILDDHTPLWWHGAVVFFVLGDVVTTLIGFQIHAIVEASPLAAWLINAYGLELMLPFKVAVTGGFYGFYRIVPHPHSVGVPLGLCALGFVVTVWNGAVIFAAVL